MKNQIEKLWDAYNNQKMDQETIMERAIALIVKKTTAEERSNLEHLIDCCQDDMNEGI